MSIKVERKQQRSGGLSIQLQNGSKIEFKKPEPKKLEISLNKKEEPVPEPKKEEPKEQPKPAPKKEESKPAPKKEEPKPAPKKEEPKPAPKKEEPAPEDFEEEEEVFTGEILDESRKKHINLVFIGHVDAGKSTLCGHILVEAGIVDQRTIERYQKEATEKGRGSWYYSWVMDLSDSERAKGITEEVGVARFETDAHKYTILDAPGHRTFVPEMIGGAVQADVAVLVVSARTGEFEAGFNRGGQTSEHLLIAKTAGVRYVIIVINKMDDPTVQWSQQRYDMITQKLDLFIATEIQFKKDQYQFIPIAALGGGNVKERSKDCTWYNGPTLFEALDAVPLPPRNEKDSFRLPVIDRYKNKSVYASGKIEKGVIHEKEQVIIMPAGVKATINSILHDEDKIRLAAPGDNIIVQLQGVDLGDVTVGSVICPLRHPCDVAQKAIVKLKLTPSAPQFVAPGFLAVCHIHTEIVEVTFERLMNVLAPKPEKNPKFVHANQMVRCILKFARPICIETFKDFPQLGRFIIRYEGFSIAVGVVEQLPKAK
ncbi:eukaryotic peptide chain release factor GTP-binding subunit ERF3A-like isoform X1 [Histomonas meleagridis]|uniref:eukaryotic peptide chain release factor GTP-binding subunit ERF3A-like isoform X1 n=1 Tax=Histomonas meleagridis TaxID=135588 RepID=UPI0035594DD6|nr:eukaryotic peptide chain release factor GTP-binding subunit ERF3A-like isoform X1 [Histomonas meleagridis]KAH0800456.1 eukaryotic peptide chain release factor GTP-binding subunit ERF3A-like isoform X1 [Histomonas meleagridis]